MKNSSNYLYLTFEYRSIGFCGFTVLFIDNISAFIFELEKDIAVGDLAFPLVDEAN